MSFNFGQSTTTTPGSTFATNTLSGGNLFGGGDSKAFQSLGSDNKANIFSNPPTSAPAFGCFEFGAKTTASTAGTFSTPTTSSGSSPFGASKPLAFSGFTSPPNQTVGSPGFGQAPNQNAPQNLSLGQPSTPQQAPTFGSPVSQATFGGAANSNFSLAKPPTTSVFAYTPTSGFSLPQQTAATTAQANFPLASATASAGGFMQSTPAFSQMFSKSPFSLTPVSSTASVSAATTIASGAATTSGFAFSQQAPNFSLTQPTVTTTVASAFSYGPVTSFPTAQPKATPTQTLGFAQPTQTTSQPTSTSLNLSLNMNLPKSSTTGPVSQIGHASLASIVSQGGPVSQPGHISQAGKISQIGQVTQAGLQNTGLPGFPTSSTTQAAKISFSVTTSAATSQAAAPTTSVLGFNAATSGGLTFTGPSLPTSGLSFSKTSVTTTTTAATTGTVTAAATTSIISLSKSTAASTMATLTTTTTTTASGLPQPITSIIFAQLEETINKWTLELEEQEKIFINQATQINAWDRLLIANGEIILELNDTIQTVKNEQQSLEHELDFVLAQQKELEEVIAPMEKQLLNETGDRMRDPEREHMYSLAENLDTQLRQMSEDLKEVIEHLNETNRSQDTNDPIVQIGRILNAHMSSMQWIDNSIAQISTRLDQLKATHDTLRRDNERSFQLTYN